MRTSLRLTSGIAATLIAVSGLAGCGAASDTQPTSAEPGAPAASAVNPREHLGHRDVVSRDQQINRREHLGHLDAR